MNNKEILSLYPQYINTPLSVIREGGETIIEWTTTKVKNKEEEKDIIESSIDFLMKNNIKLY
tara:strand:- start:4077 stop:4262 length:186 start_codon:yes stop_codon:yes gene_type:complete